MRTVKEVLAIAKQARDMRNTPLYFSKEYFSLFEKLYEDKIFRCTNCHEKVSYNALENWQCDFNDLENGLICSYCYEEEMGDDL